MEALTDSAFFQHRFSFGDLIGAEMPAGENVVHILALDTAHDSLYCSCPFFPKPCVHARALSELFRREGRSHFPEAAEQPLWLEALLSGNPARRQAAGDAEKRVARQQKTRFERLERAENGFEDLETWLFDTIRRGLATVVSEDPAAFEHLASRAADAGMTGLSRSLRLLSAVPVNAADWTTRTCEAIAQVYLAVRAFQNRDVLPESLLHDLQNFMGIHYKKEEVLASGERITDTWAVAGAVTEPFEGKLLVRRTWLLGVQSGRTALLLDFAFGDGFPPGFHTGSTHQGTLVFYASSFPQRALVGEDFREIPEKMEKMSGYPEIEHFLDAFASALAVQPWLPHFAGAILHILVQREPKGRFFGTDISGKILPLSVPEPTGWSLLSLGGGRPMSVFGEWNGQEFRPLSAVAAGRLVDFGTDR